MREVRTLQPQDDITPYFGPLYLNADNVFVLIDDGVLAAVCLVFDGGHEIAIVDAFHKNPDYQGRGVWPALLQGMFPLLKERGVRFIMGYISNPQLLRVAQKLLGGVADHETTHYSIYKEL